MLTALRRLTVLAAIAALLVLPTPDANAGSYNVIKKELSYSQFAANTDAGGSLVGTLTVFTPASKMHVLSVWMQRRTVFAGVVDAGPSVTAATISVGKSGSLTKYLAATNVFTGSSTGFNNATIGATEGVENSGTPIIATLTTTGANTNVLTQGMVTVYIAVSSVPP